MASLDGIASVDVIVRDRKTGEPEERQSDVSIGSVARRPTVDEMILSALPPFDDPLRAIQPGAGKSDLSRCAPEVDYAKNFSQRLPLAG